MTQSTMMPARLPLLAALMAWQGAAAPSADRVDALPGWDGALPSQWWSGYVNVSGAFGEASMHYVFVESEGDPSTDPVILWSNGGPGASSLFGLLVELGPLLLNDQSLAGDAYEQTGVPTLFYNPSAWTRLGSVLLFDWPPPVGFSYCGGAVAGDGNSCGAWNDTRAAEVDFAALRAWFDAKFPEYKANDLYLTGESYAGVYVPKLAQQVLADADARGPGGDALRLRGFAVGDACAGTDVLCGDGGGGPWWSLIFLYGHGQISNLMFDNIVQTCGVAALQSGATSAECDALVDAANDAVGGYFGYALYDDCIYEEGLARRRLGDSARSAAPLGGTPLGGAVNDYVCGGGVANDVWVMQPSVRDALHVPRDANFFSGDNGDGMTYDLTERNLMPFYRDVAAQRPDVRVLVYNGDTDPGINSFVSQNWTVALGLAEAEAWRPWTLDGCQRMGGYATRYAGDFDFVTVRGAGHMVPQFKPEAALAMMRSWIAGESWLRYNASCTAPAAPVSARATAAVEAEATRLERRARELRAALL